MQIALYTNSSDDKVVNKTISLTDTLTGCLKQPCNILNPVFDISNKGPVSANYCYIEDFSRYYFIQDQQIISDNILRLFLSIDVLMSYAADIKNISAVLDNNSSGDKYMSDTDIFKTSVKTATDVINFPSGFNDEGEFILITAGG